MKLNMKLKPMAWLTRLQRIVGFNSIINSIVNSTTWKQYMAWLQRHRSLQRFAIVIPVAALLSGLLVLGTIYLLNREAIASYRPSPLNEIISLEPTPAKNVQPVVDRQSQQSATPPIAANAPVMPSNRPQSAKRPSQLAQLPDADRNRTGSTPLATPAPITPVLPQLSNKLLTYRPREVSAPANATNFGDRYAVDVKGNPVTNQPIIVLHETVGSAQSAINFFQTPHTDESMQASYHAIVALNGTIIYTVPPEKRAFGAGNSVFRGPNGLEAVQTDPKFPPSVNNFAYHISLETPSSGRNNNNSSHSGYTEAQYLSLAWLIAQTQVPLDRITTHKAVDRSGSRMDPRSFSNKKLMNLLKAA